MLAWTIYSSFLGAIVLMFMKPERRTAVRLVALLAALVGLCIAVIGVLQAKSMPALQTVCNVPWIPTLGIRYHLAADGISLTLLLLTGIAAVVGILFSWNIERRVNEFFALYLALIGGVYGVFLSFDLFLLFVFYELAIIPKYFLIAIWGSTRKEYGAMKLALYSFVGSAMVLIGLVAAYAFATTHMPDGTFNLSHPGFGLIEMARFPFPPQLQYWAFPLVFIGFAILAGLWPFHTWAPTGHVAAPTAASMLLAGVVMKLGAYGALRVAMTLFPQGLMFWREPLAILAVIGIVYGGLIALVQRDFKFVIGYSSVSHMGFVLLGMMTLTSIGLSGAVLQMFSHGIIAGLLFGVVGRMVYDRTHTRDFPDLQFMGLNKALPFAAFTFVIGSLASMGMPGFSGFVAELQVLIGAWRVFPLLAIITAFGILVGVAYIVRAIQKSFFGPAIIPAAAPAHPLPPITMPERLGAIILMATTLFVGLYPKWLLDLIQAGLSTPIMSSLLKAGGA